MAGIDGLVGGPGFESGHIYEVFGPPDSGKTQLALSLAANCATSRSNVLYLDVKGDFSPERLSQISRERSGRVKSCLDNVRVKRIFTLAQLNDILDCIEGLVTSREGQSEPFWSNARLLVVDNVASLVYPEMDDDDEDGVGGRVRGDRMKEVFGGVEVAVGSMQRLASEHRMCVLIVNNAVAGGDDDHDDGGDGDDCRPALGRILSNAADVRLRVAVDGPSRRVSVDRGIRLVPGATCKIAVTERGWDEHT